MSSAEPEAFGQVTVVPYKFVGLLAGTTSEVETTEFWVTRHWQNNSVTLTATRDSKKIEVTVDGAVFKEFLDRLQDLVS
jgi:hypothetical protein